MIAHVFRWTRWTSARLVPVAIVWALAVTVAGSLLYPQLGAVPGWRATVLAELWKDSVLVATAMSLGVGVLVALLRRRLEEVVAVGLACGMTTSAATLLLIFAGVRRVFPAHETPRLTELPPWWPAGAVAVALALGALVGIWLARRSGSSPSPWAWRSTLTAWGMAALLVALSPWLPPLVGAPGSLSPLPDDGAGAAGPYAATLAADVEPEAEEGARRSPPPLSLGTPVVLVTVDTLRASHMSLYGYRRETTPNLDRWAREGVVFDRATTPKTYTSPAIASMFTGLYPAAHGVQRHPGVLASELPTMAEAFAAAGHRTAAFVTNVSLTHRDMGFARGFETWRPFPGDTVPAAEVVGAAREWLESVVLTGEPVAPSAPFLLWLHLIDPHTPYLPPSPFDDAFVGDLLYDRLTGRPVRWVKGRQGIFEANPGDVLGPRGEILVEEDRKYSDPNFLVAQYDGEIAYVDAKLGPFLEWLDGTVPEAVVLLTADHGESMTEHGYLFSHGRYAYQPTVHIPFVVHHPQLSSGRRNELVSLVDVWPTLAELVGVPVPSVDGESLVPLLLSEGVAEGRPYDRSQRRGQERAVRIEARSTSTYPILGVMRGDWKLLMTPRRWMAPFNSVLELHLGAATAAGWSPYALRSYRRELYDLATDPEEVDNLADREPETVARLEAELWTVLRRENARRAALELPEPEGIELDAESLRQLRALGYIQ